MDLSGLTAFLFPFFLYSFCLPRLGRKPLTSSASLHVPVRKYLVDPNPSATLCLSASRSAPDFRTTGSHARERLSIIQCRSLLEPCIEFHINCVGHLHPAPLFLFHRIRTQLRGRSFIYRQGPANKISSPDVRIQYRCYMQNVG